MVIRRVGVLIVGITAFSTRTLMDNTTFGITMLLVGMGGTLLTLWILAILIGGLTRLCQPSGKGGSHE